jgi:urate oxidase/2-oxo-4-hydroxy-4-carboxy-5-ureidoimidazoline decarboxylase
MNSFVSGPKRNYYGKGDVIVYRLYRDGRPNPVFGANVKLLIYGDAFWETYTTGDNTGLVATDSMKNFIQRETMNFPGDNLEWYCHFLAAKFLTRYPQAEGAQVSVTEIPYHAVAASSVAFAPAGPACASAAIELAREGEDLRLVEARSGITGFRLLRLKGSAFAGFVRDEYTTLPDIIDRPLHMWLDLDWTFADPGVTCCGIAVTTRVREIVEGVFARFESGSIQQITYQIGQTMLAELPEIAEVHLEANNRTWDTIAEQDMSVGVYTDARPPYGCLGLTVKRCGADVSVCPPVVR